MVSFVALPYQAYKLTHSSLVVGLLSLAELMPLLVTAFVGGALADAVDRRSLIRWTEAGMAVVSAMLLANALSSDPQLWVLFVCAVLVAGLDGLQRPSLDALVPRLVDPGKLAATSALMSLRSQVGMIAGPAITGVLIAAGGLPVTYGIDVASFAVSLVALAMLGATPPPPDEAELSLGAIRHGLSYAWSRKDLLGTYFVDMNAMFFGMPNALFPQFATHLGGPAALGVLRGASRRLFRRHAHERLDRSSPAPREDDRDRGGRVGDRDSGAGLLTEPLAGRHVTCGCRCGRHGERARSNDDVEPIDPRHVARPPQPGSRCSATRQARRSATSSPDSSTVCSGCGRRSCPAGSSASSVRQCWRASSQPSGSTTRIRECCTDPA